MHLTIFLPLKRLAEWVAVQSVSAWPEKRGEIKKMMEMAAKDIEKLGGTVELVDIGKQKVNARMLFRFLCPIVCQHFHLRSVNMHANMCLGTAV